MGTCRVIGTNPALTTYDSAGGKNWAVLANWEADTMIDCVAGTTSPSLSCYKGAHADGSCSMNGATTNNTYFRSVLAALGEGHAGVPLIDGSCVAFIHTNDIFRCFDKNDTIVDIVGKITADSGSPIQSFFADGSGDDVHFIGCIAFDCTNVGAGSANGFRLQFETANRKGYMINCLASNCADKGIRCDDDNDGQDVYIYNCTIVDCDIGMDNDGTLDEAHAKNVISVNNTTADWVGVWTTTTCTAEGEAGVVFKDAANDDFHLDFSDVVARNQGTDLSADVRFAFDDDINDGVMGGLKSGQKRGTDGKTWDIGFDEYMINHFINGIPVPYKINGVHAEDIKSINGVTN